MRKTLTFADRGEAGRQLAETLGRLALQAPMVFGLPRGGVAVAAEIAKALGAPLDIVLVRKIGAPDQPELAVGAVADGDDPEIVLNDDIVRALGLDAAYIAAAAKRELTLIARRRRAWASLRPGISAAGRTAIVVDDGVATGMTMQAALRHVKRSAPARLVAAVPVASREAVRMLEREADRVVCLAAPRRFGSVGAYYGSFLQVTDEEVVALLRASSAQPS